MKFVKKAKKTVFCPIFGVFFAILSLSFNNSPLRAMESHIVTGLEASAAVPSSQTGTMIVAPEMSSCVDEVTDDETRIYLPESKKFKNESTKQKEKFPCTHERCTHKASNKANLKQHLMRHTGVKPFTCAVPHCTYSAYFKSHVRAHMKNTHKLQIKFPTYSL